MRLFFVPTSPYARKVRIILRELGLVNRVEEREVTLRSPDNEALRYGPTGKVPALLLDDGRLLIEATLICVYLDELDGPPKLHPTEPAARLDAMELEGLGMALLDSLVWRSRELRRPADEQSPGFAAYEAERAERCFDTLERMAPRLDGPLTIAHITLGAALGYADLRLPDVQWREGRPRLAGWYEGFAARPSMRETAPAEG